MSDTFRFDKDRLSASTGPVKRICPRTGKVLETVPVEFAPEPAPVVSRQCRYCGKPGRALCTNPTCQKRNKAERAAAAWRAHQTAWASEQTAKRGDKNG